MNFKPLFDRVVIKNLERNGKTKSGLIIPETVGDEPVYGKVVAIGSGDCFESSNKTEMAVSVGDRVLYNKYGATNFKLENESFVVLRQSDILGVFEGESDE